MAYRTLGELRSDLRTGLGYSSAGAAAGVNQELLNQFLRNAQVLLYSTHDWARLRRYSTPSLGVGQYLLDYPTGSNPDRIRMISVNFGGVWQPPMKKGISPEHYTTQSNASFPRRWEPYDQIEFWPITDAVYSVRIFYIKALDPFTQDAHRATVDDGMIALLALANAKGHYRHPDAPNWAKQAEQLLISLKAKSWGQSTFNPSDYAEDPLPKPVVV